MIKSTLTTTIKKAPAPTFPALYRWKDKGSFSNNGKFVVLFTSICAGVVVQSDNSNRPVGYNDSWIECTDPDWEYVKGSVTLTQE